MRRLANLFYTVGLLASANFQSAYAVSDASWGYCKGPSAYNDPGFTSRKEVADWVCACPTADVTGEARQDNTLRCTFGQGRECQIGAGGDSARHGDHSVPSQASYWAAGTTKQYPDVRCECGCFTADVNVLTTAGYRPIGDLAKVASSENVHVGTFGGEGGVLQSSGSLLNKDFTVGPEEKPAYVVTAANGSVLTMTEVHPVAVEREGQTQMVPAAQLVLGDKVLDADGRTVSITSIHRKVLPSGDNKVFNLDTKGKTAEGHVILANGLRVGDVVWQRALSEKEARIRNILSFGTQSRSALSH